MPFFTFIFLFAKKRWYYILIRLQEIDAFSKGSLELAFVGDAVFTLFVRNKLVLQHNFNSGILSKKCTSFVNANAQCKMLYALEGKLTETEEGVVRRARNSSHGTKAKNSSIDNYNKATALEALFGFLYLTGQIDRLQELQEICYSLIANSQ